MKLNKSNQAGFTNLDVMLSLAIVIILASGAWYLNFYRPKHLSSSSSSSLVNSSQSTQSIKTSSLNNSLINNNPNLNLLTISQWQISLPYPKNISGFSNTFSYNFNKSSPNIIPIKSSYLDQTYGCGTNLLDTGIGSLIRLAPNANNSTSMKALGQVSTDSLANLTNLQMAKANPFNYLMLDGYLYSWVPDNNLNCSTLKYELVPTSIINSFTGQIKTSLLLGFKS